MITNFENITVDLSQSDKIYESYLYALLRKHVGETNALKSNDIVDIVNQIIANKHGIEEAKFTEVRLRKFINYYRVNGLVPVCATSKGYFITFENSVLESQCKSLEERANGINLAAKGLRKWIK